MVLWKQHVNKPIDETEGCDGSQDYEACGITEEERNLDRECCQRPEKEWTRKTKVECKTLETASIVSTR